MATESNEAFSAFLTTLRVTEDGLEGYRRGLYGPAGEILSWTARPRNANFSITKKGDDPYFLHVNQRPLRDFIVYNDDTYRWRGTVHASESSPEVNVETTIGDSRLASGIEMDPVFSERLQRALQQFSILSSGQAIEAVEAYMRNPDPRVQELGQIIQQTLHINVTGNLQQSFSIDSQRDLTVVKVGVDAKTTLVTTLADGTKKITILQAPRGGLKGPYAGFSYKEMRGKDTIQAFVWIIRIDENGNLLEVQSNNIVRLFGGLLENSTSDDLYANRASFSIADTIDDARYKFVRAEIAATAKALEVAFPPILTNEELFRLVDFLEFAAGFNIDSNASDIYGPFTQALNDVRSYLGSISPDTIPTLEQGALQVEHMRILQKLKPALENDVTGEQLFFGNEKPTSKLQNASNLLFDYLRQWM